MKVFKLIVRASPHCLDVLRFLNKNIETINRLGAAVKIEKITADDLDEELTAQLRRNGIGRLPAMLAPDGKVFLGTDQIVLVFDKNLTAARVAGNEYQSYNTEMGTNADLGAYWMQELYAGQDRRTGRRVPRKDPDETEDTGTDINRRLAQYERNVPRHRRQTAREANIDVPARQRTMRRDDNIADTTYDDEPDTVPQRDYERPATMRNIPPQADGDAIDQMMMTAWRDNTADA